MARGKRTHPERPPMDWASHIGMAPLRNSRWICSFRLPGRRATPGRCGGFHGLRLPRPPTVPVAAKASQSAGRGKGGILPPHRSASAAPDNEKWAHRLLLRCAWGLLCSPPTSCGMGEDLEMGRVYLPLQELRAFGLSEEDLRAHRVDERWRSFMRFQIAWARQLYAEAWPGIALLPSRARWAIAAAADLYRGILEVIEREESQGRCGSMSGNPWPRGGKPTRKGRPALQ